jgi:hypothetical protein
LQQDAAPGPGDTIPLEPGAEVPVDAEVIAGTATVDESAVTGESAPVVREPVPGRHTVLAGTHILSGHITVRPLPTPLPRAAADTADNAAPWWPLLALAAATLAASVPGHGILAAISLAVLALPLVLAVARAATRRGEQWFWRSQHLLPLAPDALRRAARCDTLLLPGGAIDAQGHLTAVDFLALPGVSVREVAAAAHQATRTAAAGARHSVYILARHAGGPGGAEAAEPLCGPVAEVAAQVADRGGRWPSTAVALEATVRARGGEVLAVADGGKPLGLVELRPHAEGPTLDDALRAGISLSLLEDPAEVHGALAALRAGGRRVAVPWEDGMPRLIPQDADVFVLAGRAWAASGPTAVQLDGVGGRLPGVLLSARRQRRAGRLRHAAAAALDVPRTLWCLRSLRGALGAVGGHPVGSPLLLLSLGSLALGTGLATASPAAVTAVQAATAATAAGPGRIRTRGTPPHH